MRALAALILLTLAKCAQQPLTWDRPDTTQAQFNEDAAGCRLFARSQERGSVAYGSPAFVGLATIGASIANARTAQANSNDCMMAHGYQPEPTTRS